MEVKKVCRELGGEGGESVSSLTEQCDQAKDLVDEVLIRFDFSSKKISRLRFRLLSSAWTVPKSWKGLWLCPNT